MPDIVNDDDLSALAAEYVLGTLDGEERTRANVLLDVDHQFRGLVRVWERRFGELHLMVEPVDPDPKIWTRINGKLSDAMVAAATAPTETQATAAASAAPTEPSPEQKLAGIMLEVEKFAPETAAAEATSVAPATPDAAEAGPKGAPAVSVEVTDGPSGAEEPAEADRASERLLREPIALLPREETQRPPLVVQERRPRRRGLGAYALLMTLVACCLAGLIASWRFIPDRLPPLLRPAEVLKLTENRPPERKPPPSGQFDE